MRHVPQPRRRLPTRPLTRVLLVAAMVSTLVTVDPPPAEAATTLTVDSFVDRADANPGNGSCAASDGSCSLRAAINEANSLPGHDTIVLPAGVYEIEIPTLNDDLDGTGDFDIHTSMTIQGAGSGETGGATVIDAGFPLPGADPVVRGIDRLFEIHPTAGNVTFRNLTIREGYSEEHGGGVVNWSSGLIRFENVHLLDNLTGGVGGAIHNGDPAEYEWAVEPLNPPKPGRIEIVNSVLSGNAAGTSGAAINNSTSGMITITNSDVVDNPGPMIPDPLDPEGLIPGPGVYEPAAGAVANEGFGDAVGTLKIVGSTVAGNYATDNGAGVSNAGSGVLTIEGSTFEDNTSEANGGAIHSEGGTLTITDTTVAGNTAHQGGGIHSNGSVDTTGLRPHVEVAGSTIEGNTSVAGGGGMYSGGEAQVDITDVIFAGNFAGDAGGGLSSGDRTGTVLSRVTFSGNATHDEGGGAFSASARQLVVQDSVFIGNEAGVPEPGEVAGDPSVNVAGGGGLFTENGPVQVSRSTFDDNSSSEEGGGISLDNHGDVLISDSRISNNRSGDNGGGVENSGTSVTFERLDIKGNRAELNGGGIYNSSSGQFFILDTTVKLNSAVSGGGLANAPDNDLIVRRSTFLRNTARNPGLSEDGDAEEGGLGGGIYSLADGDALIENSTISGNTAGRGGGGLFHDADGQFRLTNVTIWRNRAPSGGGVGVVESDFVPEIPPKANPSVISRNSIIGGSLEGGSCDWYITSEGGNLDGGTTCFLSATPTSDSVMASQGDRRSSTFTVDAIADNGGQTPTHALTYGSLAIDGGVTPCPNTDQRGVDRPQNGHCDTGAYEFVGAPPPADDEAPATLYLSGPVQDSLETVAFTFTGSDNLTATIDLQYECRLLETDLAEEPEIFAPWEPVPVELWWVGCSSPWQAPILEEGLFTFQVRAIDRAGNVDPTPAIHVIGGADTSPPDTTITEKPPTVTASRSAAFSFGGTDNLTPAQFLEFECRLDSRDPELWLECFNPTFFSNLTSGEHTLEVRAIDGAENYDPTPVRYTWTVGQVPDAEGSVDCDLANITLTAVADGWVDEVNPLENYLFQTELQVRSGATGDPTADPPEPLVGENARAMFRFNLPDDSADCVLESATLRLYNESPTEGRTMTATPLGANWLESSLTWFNQPGLLQGAPAVSSTVRHGYMDFDVKEHVLAMLEAGVSHGWSLRDANENDPEGGDQSLLSREMPQDPPDQTLPLLVLRYNAEGGTAPAPPELGDASPTTVHCGQVLTENTLVANDLIGCLGEGLVIGAPNIVVDLDGHTITSGLILEPGEEDALTPGIRNGGHSNVVIRNGTIRGFGNGVLLGPGTTYNVVEDMTLTGNALSGVTLFDADDGRNGNIIRDNHFDHNGETGISLVNDSENSVVENNTFLGNGMSIYLFLANGHRVEGNTISGVVLDPLLDSDAGIVLEQSSRNTLVDNSASDTGDAGIVVHEGSHQNQIEGGVLVRNGDAGVIITDSDRNQVVGITANMESDGGVVLSNAHDTVVRDSDLRYNPSGIEASGTNNLVVENNDGSNSLEAGFSLGNGLNIHIEDNTANNTGGSGISLEGAAFDGAGNAVGGALIEGNTTNENAEHGLSVADGGHTIAGNTAHHNAGFGIMAGESPPPTEPAPAANIDGDGNVASGNGESEQCVGVVCESGEPPPLTQPDLTAPDVTITSGPDWDGSGSMPANPVTGSTSATFEFTATDGEGGAPLTALVFECRLDPGPDPVPEVEPPDLEPPDPGQPPDPVDPPETLGWVECNSPFTYQGLDQGPHHFEVRVLDPADNVDLTPATYDWQIDISIEEEGTGPDSVPPTARISSAPAASTDSTAAMFTFAGSDNLTPGLYLSFECVLDPDPGADPSEWEWAQCTSPQAHSGLEDGAHTFAVRAVDRALNEGPPAFHTWSIVLPPPDVTPPETDIDSWPDPITVDTDAIFDFSSDEPLVTFQCSLDGAPFEPCTTGHQLTGLAADAPHTFQVRAVDSANNVDPTPASYTWHVGASPQPGFVFCGQLITQSIEVRNDLTDCLYDGLIIGKSGITVDLNGHTIDGKGLGAGIRNDGFDSVSIKNGRVQDFDFGVMLNVGTTANIVEGVTVVLNQEAGMALGHVPPPLDPAFPPPEEPPPINSGVNGNTLRNNTVLANDVGVWLTNGARDNLILSNSVSANGKQGVWVERARYNRLETNTITGSGDSGVSLQGATNNLVLDNDLNENGGGIYIGVTDSGTVGIQANENRIEKNTIVESGGPGIEVVESDGNDILDNVASHSNGNGLTMYYSHDSFVLGNDLRNNKGGIALSNSTGNHLEDNDASESDGTGVSLLSMSTGNLLLKNISSHNDGDGFYIGDETAAGSGNVVEGNTADNNKGYGIFVPKVSHLIKANTANDNGGWGIWASEGSNGRLNIDGGGNRAQGNVGPLDPFTLLPLQCFTIACDGGPPVGSDLIAPETLILESPPDVAYDTHAEFTFTGTDNASGVEFQCQIDATGWAPCQSSKSYDLALGVHTFQVRAIDLSGNVDLSPDSRLWSIDPPAAGVVPETTIDTSPDPTTVETTAAFTFSANMPATFVCSLDSAPAVSCTSPQPYSGLSVGTHTFTVRATSTGNGQADPAPAMYTWTITPPAVEATVGCGEIIVQSTRLLNDLINCGGPGLIIGAQGITVDLDGHLIDGVGLDAGILNNGYDRVTITNGVIQDFDYGILLNPGTSLNVVSAMRLELNQEAGLALSDADQSGAGNIVRENTIVSNGYGIALFSNTRFAQIVDNALSTNAADGIHLEFSSENRIERNEITRSGGAGILMMGGGGNLVAENELTDNSGLGIVAGEELLPSNDNRIVSNSITQGQGGIAVIDSALNQVLFNVVSGTTGPGLVLELARGTEVRGNDVSGNAAGIEIEETSNSRVVANNASGTLGTGISVGLSTAVEILQNTANANSGEGISIEDGAPVGLGNVVQGNTADGNGGDGIGVYGVGHTITGNSAKVNGGWGIYAAAGVTDGGGNAAAGNAEPAQCFGIACNIGTIPGEPETWIESGPPSVSNSRNASFTYMGSHQSTPLNQLVFECRLDTANDLAWEDCEYPAEYLNLSPGLHVFEVRTVGLPEFADSTPARHEWTYVPLPSGVAPEVLIDVAPDAETWALDAIFTFHSNEPDVTFECKVDLFGYEPCGFEGATYMNQGAFEWGLEETEVGLHTFSVRAIDFEGNVGEPATYTWRLLGVNTIFTAGPGFTPPETPFEPATGGEVAETTATIDFEANIADGATFECSLDLEPFTPCTPPVTYTALIPGEHLLRVVATDSEGITQPEASEYEWTVVEIVDVTPPQTTIERAPANGSSSTIFEFAGTDDLTPIPLLTFECRVDSVSDLDWFECVSPFNLLDLYTYEDLQMAPGPHTFEVRAIDIAEPIDPNSLLEGNPDPTPASHTWTMVADTTPPGTGIISGPPATVGEGEILFEFFGTDNATPVVALSFECSVDLGPFEPCQSPEAVQGLLPGDHTFNVRAVDLAGNVDGTPATRAFTVVPSPVTSIVSGPAGRVVEGATAPPIPSTSEAAVFVFAADQDGSTFECSLDGADFVPCSSPHAFWVVESGTHEFEVRATNPEGVVEDPPAVYQWVVELGPDTTPPNTSVLSGPANPSTSNVATFTLSGSDNRTPGADLTFECALDGTAYNSCTSPEQFSDLTHGSHTLLVRAVDAAGNFDTTPASYTWSVELPPVTTITGGPDEVTDSTDATFQFQANLAGSTYQCWLDGVIEPCTSPTTYSGLAGGEHLFAVLATGPAGSLEQAWAEWEWTIADTTPPLTTIESGPDLSTTSTAATFVFSANEPDVTYMCSLDGREPQPCVSPVEYPRLHPGPHTFEVVALSPLMLDPFGEPIEPLFDPVPTAYQWTIIDLEPPDTTIQYGPASTTAATSAYFGFASDDPLAVVECSLDGAGFGECESPLELTDLTPGPHNMVARAVDPAGNVDPTPVTYSWTIVTMAPNTPVGTNVMVELPLPGGGVATLTFFEVATAGVTTLDVLNGGPPLSAGYMLAGGQFYDISTTAEFGEPATLCVPFDPADFADSSVRLLHFDGSVWIDVTTMSDPAGMVCGQPESFSPFAVAAGSGLMPLASIISGPPNPSFSGTATFSFVSDPGTMTVCSLDGLPFTPCTSPITYTHLEEGSQEFMVQAIGFDGQVQIVPTLYEWEVILPTDTTPPDTTLTVTPPLLSASFISFVEFTGSDDQTEVLELEFECSVDGGPFESCETPEEVEVLTAGEHTLRVRAVDLAGNADPTPATHVWMVVDFGAPETSIDLGPDSETEATGAIFEFSGVDGDAETPVFSFECSIDNLEFAPCASPYEISGLTAGPHVFQVRAVDLAGIVDPSPEFYEWLIIGPVDTTAPDTFIVAGPNPDNSGPDVTFGFASNELVEEFECALDGSAFEACESTYELLGLTAGWHTMLVRAVDLAEIPNVDPTPALWTWQTTGVPDTTIVSGPPDPSGGYSATFTFESDQEGATFQCSVDGTPYVPCTSPFLAGPLTEGGHEFEVRAVNQYLTSEGEQVVDTTPATYQWEMADVAPPDTSIVEAVYLPPTDLVEPNSWRFQFTGTDNRTASFELSFECSIDGGPFEGCDMTHWVPVEDLAGGEHVLEARAVDDLDNVDPTPATHTFSTEGPPETTIVTGPAAEVDSTEATFTFSSDQGDATFECSLDGAAVFTSCDSPVTFTDVPYGEHELLVRAIRPLGTVDATPAEYSWVSGEMSPPIVTILSGPTAVTTDTSATFTFTSDDPVALFQCSLDDSPLAFCDSGTTYSGLLGGEHSFEVTPVKPNMLVEAEPAIFTWVVEDLTAPETEIVVGPDPLTSSEAISLFTLSSDEPDAGFECSLDGAAFEQCAGPAPDNVADLGGLPAGEHTVEIRAVDPSLNVDPTPASYTWVIVAPPQTLFTTGPGDPNVTGDAVFAFVDQPGSTYECALDSPDGVSGFSPCDSPRALTDLTDGAHVFSVRATNALGEVETPAATFQWTVAVSDSEAPSTSLGLTPPVSTTNTGATFTFGGSDNRTASEGLTFECSLDGAAPEGCTTPAEFSGLAVGDHTFEVAAVDLAGNVDPTPAAHSWTVEPASAPNTPAGTDVTVDLSLPEGAGSVSVTFANVTTAGVTTVTSVGAGDPLPTGYLGAGATFFDVSTNAIHEGALTVCVEYGDLTSPVRLLHLESGDWVDITTSDQSGVVCGEPGSLSPFVIATATAAVVPDTFIEFGPASSTVNVDADFSFSSNDPLATFECALDDPTDWGSCQPTTTFSDLTTGEHVLMVRAKSTLGVFDASPAVHQWTVTPMPETTITSAPSEATEEATATFEFTSDLGVGFECALDEAATYTPCESPAIYAGLAQGEHDFSVRAVDASGNVDPTPADWSWEIGDVPSLVTILTGPTAQTESNSATFTFTADDPLLECRLDSGIWSLCTSPKTYNGLPLGSHTFEVRDFGLDLIGDAPVSTYSWTVVDTTAPDTVIDISPETVTGSTGANFDYHSTEPGSTFECALDGEPFVTCDAASGYSNLSLGDHTFEVQAIDPGGNFDPTPASHAWTVVGPPVTTILTGPASEIGVREAAFTFESNQAGVGFECSLDMGPWVECSSPHQATDLVDGEHVLSVRSVTSEGVTDLEPPVHEFVVEAGIPQTTLVSTPASNTTLDFAIFTFSANESSVTFTCWLDGVLIGQPDECLSGVGRSDLSAGSHTFEVAATDEAGNVESPPVSYTWTVLDITAPETTITSGPPATTTSTSATFGFSSSEPGSAFECALDGSATSCTSPVDLSGLGVGSHIFTVAATDSSGNDDPTPASRSWTIEAPDTASPETELTVQVLAGGGADINFQFTGSDNETPTLLLAYECRLDGADADPWTFCSPPETYFGVGPGDHEFEVRAIDQSGNADPTPASHEWSVASADTTPPETTIDSGPTDGPSTNAEFTFSASEPEVTYTCVLDGVSQACSSPASFSGLTVGEHTLLVRATDTAGNQDPTAAVHEWTVEPPPDTTAPETTVGSGPAASTTDTGAGFTFSASETSTFECSLDGAGFAACTSPASYTGLLVGGHTFQVRARDAAGNVDGTPATHTWTITAPACTGGTVTLTANADAWINQGSPADNKGSDSVLKVMSKSGNANLRALVNFSMPSLPAGCAIQSATLTMNAGSSASGRTLQALRITSAWTEAGVNWSNQPTTNGTATTASGSGARNWDVTALVQAMYAPGGGLHGFMIRDAVEGQSAEQQFNSREKSTNRPRLVITMAPGVVDTTAPETTVGSGPAASTTDAGAGFTFSASETSTFECSLDGAGFAACTSPASYTGLLVGGHTFQVRARDAAGNVDGTPATHTWTITAPVPDTTAPETTVGSGPAASTTDTGAGFTFSASETSTFECSLDGAGFAACTSPASYTGLLVGGHTFQVRARDAAGNVDGTPATHTWTITAPACTGGTVTLTANADAWINQGSPADNKGSDSVLKVMSKSGNANLRALVNFSMPSLPAGCAIQSATLTMNAGSSASGRTLQALRITSAWTEAGVNWSNQPTTNGTATTASGSGARNWDVTALVQAMYAPGGGLHGFMIRDAVEDQDAEQQLNSRETGANAPQLIIVFG